MATLFYNKLLVFGKQWQKPHHTFFSGLLSSYGNAEAILILRSHIDQVQGLWLQVVENDTGAGRWLHHCDLIIPSGFLVGDVVGKNIFSSG